MTGEMVLLAMLPEENDVMLVQMPCMSTVADLEDFVVNEYSRVYPYKSALSRDLRIQKRVSLELVVDHRSYTTMRQDIPHSLVDLAKNVQVGNVFQNMEQIYIRLNKTDTKKKSQESNAIVAHSLQTKKRNVVKQQQHALKKTVDEALQKQPTPKEDTIVASTVQPNIGTESSTDTNKNVQDVCKEKTVLKNAVVDKKSQSRQQKTSGHVTKTATEEINDIVDESNAVTMVSVAETYAEKVDTLEKTNKANKTENDDVKSVITKDNTSGLMNPVVETTKKLSKQAAKKSVTKKSENALLKKMLAARHNASQSGAASVVHSLQGDESSASKVSPQSERKRKADEEGVSTGEEYSASNAVEHLTKKKRTVKKVEEKMPELVKDGVDCAKVEKVTKKVAAQDKNHKTTSKVANTLTESQLKADSDSIIASESASANRKIKKKADTKLDEAEEPLMERVKSKALPKSSAVKKGAVKKTAEKVKKMAKSATSETRVDTSGSPSSGSSSSSATPKDEAACNEETKAAEAPVIKKAGRRKQNENLKEILEQKTGFQKSLADTVKRIAGEQKASDSKTTTPVVSEKQLAQTQKSVESTASESSSDSDQPAVDVRVVKRSQKNVTSKKGSSSSSSEDEELDYSQRLLADLTNNDTDEEEVVPVVHRKGKKSKQIAWRDDSTARSFQDMEHSEGMPSSELTQKSQELNSVLLPPLSRKRFSLDSMPVAKLKRSSKNPFLSPNKAKAKDKTSSATDRPRGRPRK